MFPQEQLNDIRELYINIFEENVENSIEFTNFAKGKPNLLRIKVEDWIINADRSILESETSSYEERLNFMQKFLSAKELDTIITTYIEENYYG
jgi:Holliday junction resolvase